MKRAKQVWMKEKVRENQRRDRDLAKEVVAWVGKMNLFGTTVLIPENNSLALRLREYIDKNYRNTNYTEKDEMINAINRRLCEIGLWNFSQVSVLTRPDNVFSPEALAFAIFHEHLTKDQIRTVELLLDHGETLKKFVFSGVHLPMIVLSQLETAREKATPHKWPESSRHSDDTECFESH